LQLFSKAKLLAEGADYPRTYSVRVLLEILSELVPEDKRSSVKKVLEDCLLELGMLEDAYITSRYLMREFTRQEVEKPADAVKEIIENVS